MENSKVAIIKNIYLYLVSFVSLMMITISMADIVNILLKTYVFTKADTSYYYSNPSCAARIPAKELGIAPMTEEECAKENEANQKRDEENRSAQKQRDLVRDISFIAVGLPLFIYHWLLVRKKQ